MSFGGKPPRAQSSKTQSRKKSLNVPLKPAPQFSDPKGLLKYVHLQKPIPLPEPHPGLREAVKQQLNETAAGPVIDKRSSSMYEEIKPIAQQQHRVKTSKSTKRKNTKHSPGPKSQLSTILDDQGYETE